MNRDKETVIRLKAAMNEYLKKDCIVAFSGGVDSSLVLKLAGEAAVRHKTKVYAVTVHTSLHPMNDLAVAGQVAREVGAVHQVIHIDELSEAGIANNPPDRCYRCKKHLFEQIRKLAHSLFVETILEGTNADDLQQYRPGIRALRELEIISPLADAGLTKTEVRQLAEEYGISVAKRPSAPCLATRFPYGTPLSIELMKKIEAAETFVRACGFYNVRLRLHGDVVRIETDADRLAELVEKRAAIIDFLKAQGFVYLTIDLEGFRSGSMDIGKIEIDQEK